METVIYEPLEDYEKKYKALHQKNTEHFFEDLVKRSGVDAEQNRKTVAEYEQIRENVAKLRKKRNWLRFFRVLMCLTILLIPLVIIKMTPKIRQLKEQIDQADQKAAALLEEAERQMLPLNQLFTDTDALRIMEMTVPLLRFDPCFSAEQEADMKINYDFGDLDSGEQSTCDVLAGHYNGNPFLFENKVIHTMGVETYHGYKTISWTETYFDSNGKMRTRRRSETLHATVTKPKPFYTTQAVLNYCAQGAPDLTFSRDASHLEQKSEKEIERYVKKGEKRLKKKTDKALWENDDFVSMSNSDFEVLFDALDRTNEVQFRTLFTPLAQTNMVELLLSQNGYGDDFHFIKRRRTNQIISNHSQGRALLLKAKEYKSYAFDTIRDHFLNKNAEYFKAVYFDFAPLLAIPMYQERPVHSLKPIPDTAQQYSLKECEALANVADRKYMAHPDTKTQVILKTGFIQSRNHMDEICITAYSYDIEKRVDVVSVYGGDGRYHSVSVPWDEYMPLEAENRFLVTADGKESKNRIAQRNGLCMICAK